MAPRLYLEYIFEVSSVFSKTKILKLRNTFLQVANQFLCPWCPIYLMWLFHANTVIHDHKK